MSLDLAEASASRRLLSLRSRRLQMDSPPLDIKRNDARLTLGATVRLVSSLAAPSVSRHKLPITVSRSTRPQENPTRLLVLRVDVDHLAVCLPSSLPLYLSDTMPPRDFSRFGAIMANNASINAFMEKHRARKAENGGSSNIATTKDGANCEGAGSQPAATTTTRDAVVQTDSSDSNTSKAVETKDAGLQTEGA
ncbi:hypothetical protein BC567DRAFT_262934 [Phyllosticta citribraziliensis]